MAKTDEAQDLTSKQWAGIEAWCRSSKTLIESAEKRQDVFDAAIKKHKHEITGKMQNGVKCGVAKPEHIQTMCEALHITMPDN